MDFSEILTGFSWCSPGHFFLGICYTKIRKKIGFFRNLNMFFVASLTSVPEAITIMEVYTITENTLSPSFSLSQRPSSVEEREREEWDISEIQTCFSWCSPGHFF